MANIQTYGIDLDDTTILDDSVLPDIEKILASSAKSYVRMIFDGLGGYDLYIDDKAEISVHDGDDEIAQISLESVIDSEMLLQDFRKPELTLLANRLDYLSKKIKDAIS